MSHEELLFFFRQTELMLMEDEAAQKAALDNEP